MLRVIGVVGYFYVSAFKNFANQCCFLFHVREYFEFVIILAIYILLTLFSMTF